ncbi:hypothetical protein LPJ66_002116 [Kickxella alabastrina]|uniref:Uncharacterized protein n=1 Tax=Kickxella alabastrina TaxID=61397 RepID=A0ACC1IRB0_9FUNG|nr:hypothetical protein LPJ66_002116 [Kickxella alabastrina]
MSVKRQHDAVPTSLSSKKQRVQYYLQPTNDSNSILKRKNSNKNAESYPPGKRAKAHTEVTVDSIPPEPTSDNSAEPETTKDISNLNTKNIFVAISDDKAEPVVIALPADIAPPVAIAQPAVIARVEVGAPESLPNDQMHANYGEDAMQEKLSYYCKTDPNTTSLAEPEVTSYQKRATTVTGAVCKAMRHFMSNRRPTDSKCMLAKLIDDDSTQAAQMFRVEDAAISE